MKVLVTGERGQLGNELRRCFDTMRAEIGPIPGVYKDARVDYVDYQVLDISDADAVDAWYAEHGPYDLTINCAAITNVDPALNESAALDGANRWHQTWHITLPTIRPIIVMLLVLALGTVFSAGQEQIMLLYNPMVYESSDIIDTLVYRTGLVNHQWSLSAAVGMMKSVISFLLVAFSYRLATKHFDYQVF